MITINIYKTKINNINVFLVKDMLDMLNQGDIICAAVSILVINTINSLEEFTKTEFANTNFDEEKGIIDVSFPNELSSKKCYY